MCYCGGKFVCFCGGAIGVTQLCFISYVYAAAEENLYVSVEEVSVLLGRKIETFFFSLSSFVSYANSSIVAIISSSA